VPLVMLRLRAFALFLAALLLPGVVALGCLPPAAQATETATMVTRFVPYRLGKPTTIDINLKITSTDGSVPGPVTGFVTHLPPALELVGSSLGLAICQPDSLLDGGLSGCSPNAQLGFGTATVEVPFGPEIVSETANVEALMGPPSGEQIVLLLYAEGLTPVLAQQVLPGILVIGSGPVGESINTTVPLVPTLPGAADASMTSMHMSFGPDHLTYYEKVHGKTVGYKPRGAALPKVCPRGGFHFFTDLTFQDGTAITVPSTVPCPRSRRR
jgi:hypothetical protein